jgi:hypothetical protein
MGKFLEFDRLYDNAVRRKQIFLQEAEVWSRQCAQDPCLHVSVIADSFYLKGERYYDYVDAFGAQQLFHWPDMKVIRINRAAATGNLRPCCAAIIFGDNGSSHWIFGHLMPPRGFPDLSVLEQAKKGLSGDISGLLIGGAPLYGTDQDDIVRRNIKNAVMKQLSDVGLPVDPGRMKTYWNTTQSSYNNVFARIDKEGKPWIHVELVYTLASIC